MIVREYLSGGLVVFGLSYWSKGNSDKGTQSLRSMDSIEDRLDKTLSIPFRDFSRFVARCI